MEWNRTEGAMEGLRTSDYDFALPKELIAQDPLAERSSSRLLVLDKETRSRTTYWGELFRLI